MLFDFATALAFFLVGAAFLAVLLWVSRLIQPRHPTSVKLSTYECGEQPVGQSWIQFNNRFYVIALVFLIFDVEIAFLFPWAVVFKKLGLFAFVEALIFIGILMVGLAYVWRKGDLAWDKPLTGKYAREAAPELFEEFSSPAVPEVRERPADTTIADFGFQIADTSTEFRNPQSAFRNRKEGFDARMD